MIKEGQVVLFSFPESNLEKNKLRPALILKRLPGKFDDWLICMISTSLHQEISNFDEMIIKINSDFILSGLKKDSLIRISRIAVVSSKLLQGKIGEIDNERIKRIKLKLSHWLIDKNN